MRYSLIFVFCSLLDATGLAMCMPTGFWIYPEGGANIATNSIFILNRFSGFDYYYGKFDDEVKFYLESEGEIVHFTIEKCVSGSSQVVLRPIKELTMGKKYRLYIEPDPAGDDILDWNKKDMSEMYWTVTQKADHKKPRWKQKPYYFNQTFVRYGCGPSIFVNFCGVGFDDSPLLVNVKLTNKKAFDNDIGYYHNLCSIINQKDRACQEAYLTTDESGVIAIGHGMCDGRFYFNEGSQYEIVFSLMDLSGNSNTENFAPISFKAPTYEDSIHEEEKTFCKCSQREFYTKTISLIWAVFIALCLGLYFYKF